MKTEYISPKMEIVKMQQSGMLCWSNGVTSISDGSDAEWQLEQGGFGSDVDDY